ncbi:PHOsphatase [Phlyctochytrium bullatum]|nr:PHOsphatase [Phlyctochytrium bullatum]
MRCWIPSSSSSLLLVLLLAAILAVIAVVASPTSAAVNHTDLPPLTIEELRRRLGSKSPYPIRPDAEEPQEATSPPGCELVHVYMVTRHGSRNPTLSDHAKLTALQTFIRAHAPRLPPRFAALANWTNPFTETSAGQLTRAGAREAEGVGRRLGKRFGRLLRREEEEEEGGEGEWGWYDPVGVRLRATVAARAGMTVEAVARGMFSGEGRCEEERERVGMPLWVRTMPTVWDYELKSKSACPRWSTTVAAPARSKQESAVWDAHHGPGVVEALTAVLGFPVPLPHAKTMFRACAFEQSVLGGAGPWCDVWVDAGADAVERVEYLDDVEHWWKYGYGHGFNREMGCRLVTDAVGEARRAGAGKGRRVVVGGGHSDTIVFWAAVLGVAEDEGVLAGGWEGWRGRRFRMAEVAPMAANAVLEVQRCGGGKVVVRLWMNERVVRIPKCEEGRARREASRGVRFQRGREGVEEEEEDGFCDLEDLERGLGETLGCDFEEMCGVEGEGRGGDWEDEGDGDLVGRGRGRWGSEEED